MSLSDSCRSGAGRDVTDGDSSVAEEDLAVVVCDGFFRIPVSHRTIISFERR